MRDGGRAGEVTARGVRSRRLAWWVLGTVLAVAAAYGIWLLVYVATSENTLD